VSELGRLFREAYAARPNHVVFNRGWMANKPLYGLTEFLFDLSVCKTGMLPEDLHLGAVPFIKALEWCIESEFERHQHVEILKDNSKLFIADARYKLYIAPAAPPAWLARMLHFTARSNRTGRLWYAQVPHPDTWATGAGTVTLYCHGGDDWREDLGPEVGIEDA